MEDLPICTIELFIKLIFQEILFIDKYFNAMVMKLTTSHPSFHIATALHPKSNFAVDCKKAKQHQLKQYEVASLLQQSITIRYSSSHFKLTFFYSVDVAFVQVIQNESIRSISEL